MSSIAPAFARAAAARASQTRTPWVRDDRYGVALGLLTWLLILQMIVPDNFDYDALSAIGSSTAADGSPMSRLIWLALLGGGLMVVLLRRSLAAELLREVNPWLGVFAVLTVASLAWSIDAGYTLRRSIRLATFLLDAGTLALMSWHPRRFQNVVRPAVTLMLIGSLLFGLLCPQLAIHQENSPELLGAWRGLTSHKNSLGALASLGLVLWAQAWLAREVPWWKALGGLLAAAACLLLSRSDTSLMAAMFSLLLLWLLQRPSQALRPYLPYVIGGFVVCLTFYALITLRIIPGHDLLLSPVAMLTGKSTNMTGRAEIWNLIEDHIATHPLLGTGYGAYWTGPHPGTPSYVFMEQLQFYPASAHNGYLEVINDLGIAGGLCLAGYLVAYLRQCLRLLRFDANQAALFLGLFVLEAIINLSEAHWFSVLSVNFAVMVLATMALGRSLLEQRLWQAFGVPQARAPARPHSTAAITARLAHGKP